MDELSVVSTEDFFRTNLRDSLNTGNEEILEQHEHAILYISKFLTRFARADKFYVQNALQNKLSAITDLKKECGNADNEYTRTSWLQHMGDFSLFLLGLFPEYLEKRRLKRLYADSGIMAYSDLFHVTSRDLFYTMSENFEEYRGAIERAFRHRIRFDDDGSIVIAHDYENLKARGIQIDGKIEWVM